MYIDLTMINEFHKCIQVRKSHILQDYYRMLARSTLGDKSNLKDPLKLRYKGGAVI